MTTELVPSTSVPYPKILGPFKRNVDRNSPQYNKVRVGSWSCEEFELFQDHTWLWTEKIDGTNVRVHWDGVDRRFAGRTDKAQLPPNLLRALAEMFPSDLLEQTFQAQPVTLYGEGYGGKIQKGGNYRPNESFILFDVKIGRWWLKPDDVLDLATSLMVDAAPGIFGNGASVWTAIDYIMESPRSFIAEKNIPMEGIVGVPMGGFLTRGGERIIMKVKHADFGDGD